MSAPHQCKCGCGWSGYAHDLITSSDSVGVHKHCPSCGALFRVWPERMKEFEINNRVEYEQQQDDRGECAMNEPMMKKPTTDESYVATNPGRGYKPEPIKSEPGTAQILSGQQMQALAKNHADALAAIKRDVELRKWAVDQALSLVAAQLEHDGPIRLDPMKVSREIHAFLVEGATEHPPGSASA